MTPDDQLDAAFFALAHPARRAILARLADSAATVNELAVPFQMSLPAVSKHIRVLEEAGLIVKERDAQARPCRLNGPGLRVVADWAEAYRPVWEARFDKLADIIGAIGEEQHD